MLFISPGEVMRTAEVFFCTHIDIVVMHIVQHGVNGSHRRDADRSGRKSAVLVGVVRAVNREPLLINTVSREILCGELYRSQ